VTIATLSPPARKALALVAGALVPLTLSPIDMWLLALLSVALLYMLLDATTPRAAATLGWWYGFGCFGVGVSWVYVSIHDFGAAPPLLAGFLTLAFVAGLAFFFVLQCWLYRRWASRHWPVLGFAACWVLGEWFRSWFLTGFPWLYLGYAHVESMLAGVAPVFGVLGISLVVALGGALVGECWRRWQLQPSGYALVRSQLPTLFILLWGIAALGKRVEWVTADPGRTLEVALVQANIEQELKFVADRLDESLQQYAALSAPLWQHDLVVWPETALPLVYQQAGPLLAELDALALQNGSTLISGIFFREGAAIHNSLTTLGNGSGTWHKRKLVPFGEYVPLRAVLANLLQVFALPMSSLAPGPADQKLLTVAGLQVAPFICYEVVYPEFVRRQAQTADFLLTVSNDTWFGASWGPLQHLQMAGMRALENGRYMVRATNNGVSALIDEKGHIIARTPQFEAATLTGSVQMFSGRTPYSYWGNWPVLLFGWLLLLANVYLMRIHRFLPESEQ
jgi:apolipoprotein N-acyltransferase